MGPRKNGWIVGTARGNHRSELGKRQKNGYLVGIAVTVARGVGEEGGQAVGGTREQKHQ